MYRTLPQRCLAQKSLSYRFKQCKFLLLMLLPGILYIAVFAYGPMYGILIAFKNFRMSKGILGSDWVGLKNFQTLFQQRLFRAAVKNTLILSVYQTVFSFPVPILLALMLNEIRATAFKRVAQTVIYLPHFISSVIVCSLVILFLSPEYGFINDIVAFFGGKRTYFLIESRYFRTIQVLTGIWRGAGWGTIIYLAALAGVDGEIAEAAIVDGANRLQRIWHINVPCLLNVVVIMLILRMGSILNSDFETVLNLYNPLVYDVGDVLDTYIYRVGLEIGSNFSLSTAAGLFKSLIGFGLVILTNRIADRLSEGEMKLW